MVLKQGTEVLRLCLQNTRPNPTAAESRRRQGVLSCLGKGLLPLPGRNGQVKPGRLGKTCFIGPLWEQKASLLDFWLEAGTIRPGGQEVT